MSDENVNKMWYICSNFLCFNNQTYKRDEQFVALSL